MSEYPETYLGDGLYASFDGDYVFLRAPHVGRDHWVGLGPETIAPFLTYLRDISREHPEFWRDKP